MDISTPWAPSIDASSSGELIAISAALSAPAVAARRADAHQRGARAAHDALDVGEVDVDQARRGDQIGDALHTVEQHLVGAAERVHQRHAASPICSSRSLGMTIRVSQLSRSEVMPASAWLLLPLALERERPGHHADRQRTELAGDGRDDRRAAGAGAAALARGDEHHVGAAQQFLDVVLGVLRGPAPDLGVGASAETAGSESRPTSSLTSASLINSAWASVLIGDELNALEALLDHRLTAFTPPPPMPTTLIRRGSYAGGSSIAFLPGCLSSRRNPLVNSQPQPEA
jgi:hypothetical protein